PGQLHRVQVAVGGDEDVRPRAHLRAVEDPELRAHERGAADRAGIRSRGLPGLGLDQLANRLAVLEVRLRPGAERRYPLLPPPEHRAYCRWRASATIQKSPRAGPPCAGSHRTRIW